MVKKLLPILVSLLFIYAAYGQRYGSITEELPPAVKPDRDSVYSFLSSVFGDIFYAGQGETYLVASPLGKEVKFPLFEDHYYPDKIGWKPLVYKSSAPEHYEISPGDTVLYMNSELVPLGSMRQLLSNLDMSLRENFIGGGWDATRIYPGIITSSQEIVWREVGTRPPFLQKKKNNRRYASKKKAELFQWGFYSRHGNPHGYAISVPVFDEKYEYAVMAVETYKFRDEVPQHIYFFRRSATGWEVIIDYDRFNIKNISGGSKPLYYPVYDHRNGFPNRNKRLRIQEREHPISL